MSRPRAWFNLYWVKLKVSSQVLAQKNRAVELTNVTALPFCGLIRQRLFMNIRIYFLEEFRPIFVS